MRVFVDAHFLDKKMEGNRTFILSLITGLADACHRFPDPRFFFAVYNPEKWRRVFPCPAFRWEKCSRFSLKRYLWDFPRLIRTRSIELIQHIYHFPPFRLPVGIRKILVVHDVIPLSHSEHFSFFFRWRFRRLLMYSLKHADVVVCGSEFSRKELIERMGVDDRRIQAIPYGVILPAGDEAKAEPPLTDSRIALYVGRLDRRKNLDLVLNVMEQVNGRLRMPLVLVGKKENVNAGTMRRIQALSRKGFVEYRGEIPDDALSELYQQASILLYFPECEGFGYPVLEAMAHGLPFLTVDAGAVGELCMRENLVSLEDPESMVERIIRVVTDPELRGRMVAAGGKTARAHGVVEMARHFIQLYQETM